MSHPRLYLICVTVSDEHSYACSLLGSSGSGASCDAIGGNGTTGTYGALSYCSPAIKLSYAFSAYYSFNPVRTSCDFSGNATLSPNRVFSPHPITLYFFANGDKKRPRYTSRRLSSRFILLGPSTLWRRFHSISLWTQPNE